MFFLSWKQIGLLFRYYCLQSCRLLKLCRLKECNPLDPTPLGETSSTVRVFGKGPLPKVQRQHQDRPFFK